MPIETPRTALLLVDIQNDFCNGGALAVPEAEQIITPANRLLESFEVSVLTQDWHPANHQSFASYHPGKQPFDQVSVSYGKQTLWPDHCVQGSQGASFHPDLNTGRPQMIVRKGFRPEIDSYSAFFENDRATTTGLAGYLRDRHIHTVVLCGLALDFCVAYSAIDARRVGLHCIVVTDACRAIDLNGSASEANERMKAAGVQLTDMDSLTGQLTG